MSINGKIFEHRPIEELFAIVKNDFSKFDNEGLIDEGTMIKTVMWCNEKLGIPIREIREVAIPVVDFKGELPLDFEKLYYICGLRATGTHVTENVNPFDNNVDQDIIYDAHLDRESLGCVDNYRVIIKRQTNTTIHNYGTWVQLDVRGSDKHCHIDCPNKRKRGRYTIELKDDHIETPFKSGLLYMMYVGMMKDTEGNITFPFHPMITPWYEWVLKEKVITDAIFNSDAPDLGTKLQLAQQEKVKCWLDAYNITMEKSYGEYVQAQRKKELGWYSTYFKHFQ